MKEHFQESAGIELKIEFQNSQNLAGSCLLWLDYSVNKTHILNLISLQFYCEMSWSWSPYFSVLCSLSL